MDLFTVLDLIALMGLVGVWGVYSILLDWTPHAGLGLNERLPRDLDAAHARARETAW